SPSTATWSRRISKRIGRRNALSTSFGATTPTGGASPSSTRRERRGSRRIAPSATTPTTFGKCRPADGVINRALQAAAGFGERFAHSSERDVIGQRLQRQA